MKSLVLLLAAATATLGQAQDPGRFRLMLAAGGYNTQDEIRSDSGNVLTIVDDTGGVVDRFLDPRSDDLVDGRLKIEPGVVVTVAGQYAFTRRVRLQASASWQQFDVGNIELQAGPPTTFFTLRVIQQLDAGQLTQIPLRLTALSHFRPGKVLDPYLGVGIGYVLTSFETSSELDLLSQRMDASTGQPTRMFPESTGSFLSILGSPPPTGLSGATIEAEDSFEWHLAAGTELAFAKRWAAVLDLTWTFHSNSFAVLFNGEETLGASVPQGTALDGSEIAEARYGPFFVNQGGLVDMTGDGVPDPGEYYIRGGRLSYRALAARIGLRYAF